MQLTIGIGLLGCGTVGESVAILLQRDQHILEARSGVSYDLRPIAVHRRKEASVGAAPFRSLLFRPLRSGRRSKGRHHC
jgi:homoserine dehydrogenase